MGGDYGQIAGQEQFREQLTQLDRKRIELLADAVCTRLRLLGVKVDTKFSEALWQVIEDHA